jgi:hypothetical protein
MTANEPGATFREVWQRDEVGARLLETFADLKLEIERVPIPPEKELIAILHLFQIPESSIPDVLAARSSIESDEELRWLLDRHVALLRYFMGSYTRRIQFIDIPAQYGDVARFFYVYVYATMLPFTLAYLRTNRIPQEICDATFADVGRKIRFHIRKHGISGMIGASWLTRHFRGMIFQLGRLQFERSILNERLVSSVVAAGLPYGVDSPALAIHIPDYMGPFTPALCDESFAQAKSFFPAYFPEMPVDIAFCNSWLLDDQLPHHLPSTSNIVQFQKRFCIPFQGERDDVSPATFIWASSEIPATPREGASSLERAIIAHRNAGGHWGSGLGWLRL